MSNSSTLAGSADGRSALVLQRLGARSLAKVMAERGRLRTGEAITVLAPLATALARMHGAGVVHGDLSADRVFFDADGAPVLARFGCAALIPPGLSSAALGANDAVHLDLGAFARLASSVLVLVRDERAHELAALLADAVHGGDYWLETVARHIYELGDASAIDLDTVGVDRVVAHPARAITASPVVESVRRSRVLELVGAPEWIQETVARYASRLSATLRTVRPRVWIMASAVAVALITAIVIVPSSGSDATAEPPEPTAPPEVAVTAGPVEGDDPVVALVALLAQRERCIRDVSVLCLDTVDQANSSALENDQQLIRGLQSGAEMPKTPRVDATRLSVTESLGDTAIVAIDSPADSEPASILVMRSEAGWRIRDYLD